MKDKFLTPKQSEKLQDDINNLAIKAFYEHEMSKKQLTELLERNDVNELAKCIVQKMHKAFDAGFREALDGLED